MGIYHGKGAEDIGVEGRDHVSVMRGCAGGEKGFFFVSWRKGVLVALARVGAELR